MGHVPRGELLGGTARQLLRVAGLRAVQHEHRGRRRPGRRRRGRGRGIETSGEIAAEPETLAAIELRDQRADFRSGARIERCAGPCIGYV
jgi:hypothetical protein